MGGLIKKTQAFTASQTVENIISGSKFEFLPRNAVVKLYASQTVAGEVELDFTLGNVVVGDDLDPNLETAVGAVNRNTDLIASGVGAAGDRIQIRGRETSGTTANCNIIVEIIDM
mgnify:CR=1 FL=1